MRTATRDTSTSRRAFLRNAGISIAAVAATVLSVRSLSAREETHPSRADHPEPRPDITAAKVLPEEEVPERSRPAYRAAREIPGVLDGLYCHCDCAERDKMRSLLSCFETRMPTSCGICREEAVLALRLHREGRTLDEIRAAVDRKYSS